MSPLVVDDRHTPRFQVNRRAMVDEDVFAQERERIFNSSWLYLGHESELKKPNDFVTRDVAGRGAVTVRRGSRVQLADRPEVVLR